MILIPTVGLLSAWPYGGWSIGDSRKPPIALTSASRMTMATEASISGVTTPSAPPGNGLLILLAAMTPEQLEKSRSAVDGIVGFQTVPNGTEKMEKFI